MNTTLIPSPPSSPVAAPNSSLRRAVARSLANRRSNRSNASDNSILRPLRPPSSCFFSWSSGPPGSTRTRAAGHQTDSVKVPESRVELLDHLSVHRLGVVSVCPRLGRLRPHFYFGDRDPARNSASGGQTLICREHQNSTEGRSGGIGGVRMVRAIEELGQRPSCVPGRAFTTLVSSRRRVFAGVMQFREAKGIVPSRRR